MSYGAPWEIMTRTQAAAAGHKKYWTGRPCSKGHVSQRYVTSGVCCSCAVKAQARYNRKISAMQRGDVVEVVVSAHPDDAGAIREFAEALAAARALDSMAGGS